jgi:hypothetical protein
LTMKHHLMEAALWGWHGQTVHVQTTDESADESVYVMSHHRLR